MPTLTAHAAPSKTLNREKRRAGKRLSLSESGPRVETIVGGPQPRLEHVRVDLRRGQIGVTEHQLNRAQIGAALEEVRRERVPQDVRADRRRQSGGARVPFENLPEADAAQRPAARVEEQARRGAPLEQLAPRRRGV